MRCCRVLSFLVFLVALIQVPSLASAQDAAMPEGVALEYLAFAAVPGVPDGSDSLFLTRVTLAPGAALPLDPASGTGLVLAEVEQGTMTVDVAAGVQVSRADAEMGVMEAMPGGEPFTLGPGDAALFPAALAGELRNEGDGDVVATSLETLSLAVVAAAATPGADSDALMAMPEGVAFDLLAPGSVPAFPAGELFLSLSRVTYDPGTDLGASPRLGPEVAVIESGTFTLNVEEGPSLTIARGFAAAIAEWTEPVVEELGPGQTAEVSTGDAVFFPAGNVTAASNLGAEPAVVLLGSVVPASAE